MKTRLSILSLIAGILLISSCATTTKYASSSAFEDAVYQRPQSGNYLVVNTQQDSDANRLRSRTKESNAVFINGKLVEPVYANEKGEVNINLEQEKTYIILQEGESFEDRLTMFDTPNYNINITFSTWDFYNPWYWDMYYIPRPGYRFGGSLYYHPWYNPWFRPWYSPVYSYWGFYNNPWYWGWNRHFYWGWERDHYMGWHGGYHWWPRHPHTSHRDRYYGVRENPRRNNNTYYRNQGVQSGGSYRRDGRVEQVRGGRDNVQSNAPNTQSLYRRDSRRDDNQVRTSYQTQRNIERTSGESLDRRGSGGSSTVRRESGTTARSSNEQVRTNRNSSSNNEVRTTRNSGNNSSYRPSSTSATRRSNVESSRTNQSSTTQRSSGNTSTQSRSSFSRSNTESSSATRSTSTSSSTSRSTSSSSSSSSSSSTGSSSGSSSGYRR